MMRTKINPLHWSEKSAPLTLKIEGSDELAVYVRRQGTFVIYYHNEKLLKINMKDINVKIHDRS